MVKTRAEAKPKLAFHDRLTGKGLSTDTLLKRLKTLHTELAQLDQEAIDVASLSNARKDLVSTSLLLHKDRGVKAYTACSIADILRLYAPDAPYTQPELRDIFQFFFRQLTNGLKGPDSTYYNQYFHLLESLSTVKSVVLICDLPTAEELIAEIFRDFFNLVKRDLPKKVEMFMADILVALIDEAQVFPSDALEVILAQFTENNTRMDQAALRLSIQVCNATADKLQRHVCQHFTDIITASPSSSDQDFTEIRAAHDLIKRLHHSCPGLLHSVIPQLEEELRVEEVALRLIATQVLGEMFGDKGGAELVKKYPTTWTVWVLRKNDKHSGVRLKFVEATKGLLCHLFEQRAVVEEALKAKLLDPDEKVRAAVCRVYGQLDFETALHHVSEEQLRALGERGADKKQSVRVEALTSLGKLYSLALPEIENNEPLAIQQFAWIPNTMLQMIGVSFEVRAAVEQVVMECILPLPFSSSSSSLTATASTSNVAATGSKTGGKTGAAGKAGSGASEVDEVAWTDRVLLTMRYLEEKATNALLSLTGLKQLAFLPQGGIIDEDEETVTQRLGSLVQHISLPYHLGGLDTFPDPFKASEDLEAFAKLNENRLYKLLKTCMDPQTDLKGLVKATAEFQRRIEQQAPNHAATLSTLLRRSSFRILNQSSIPTLIKRLQKSSSSSSTAAASSSFDSSINYNTDGTHANHPRTLLTFVSKHSPALYKSHIGELTKAIADEKNVGLVETCLRALAGVTGSEASGSGKGAGVGDQRTMDRIMRFALSKNRRMAKFAARIIAVSGDDEGRDGLIESVVEDLPSCEPEKLVAHIAALAQMARFAPAAFERKSDVITAFLLKKVIMVPTLPDPNDMDVDEEWVADEDMSPTLQAKILALKVYRYRSLAHKADDKAVEISTPVFKMLATLLEYSGSFVGEAGEESVFSLFLPFFPKVMARMRLQAAVSLFRLSTVELYAQTIAPKFLRIAVTVQDSCYNVRVIFLSKLISLLQPRKLPPKFNIIPFLTVHDPESDVKAMASSYITGALSKMWPAVKTEHLEMIFIRLLHLLAHHPDFSKAHEELLDIAKYIQFYIELVATSENISLLFHLALKGKTIRDSESHTYTENLYVIAELAQELIKVHATSRSWTLTSYPGKVRLPSDILRPLPNPEAAKEIMKTVYLPEETISWLSGLSNVKTEKRERKIPTKRKPSVSKVNGSAKRTRRKKQQSDDDESDEPSVDEDSDLDEDIAEKMEEPKHSDHEEEEEEGAEEQLGRGARTRAKARTRRQKAKAASKSEN
ncbi:hypothetical protein C0991_010047 [Blastosporella zonata]|nr:hypothetical protein C0991_010047 [Blastosporella zonata]